MGDKPNEIKQIEWPRWNSNRNAASAGRRWGKLYLAFSDKDIRHGYHPRGHAKVHLHRPSKETQHNAVSNTEPSDSWAIHSRSSWKSCFNASGSRLSLRFQSHNIMPDRGTSNAIFNLRMISEHSIQHQQNFFYALSTIKKRLIEWDMPNCSKCFETLTSKTRASEWFAICTNNKKLLFVYQEK